MDYQSVYQQIKSMDYISLVKILLTQITPETRHMILLKLLDMNNYILNCQKNIGININKNDQIDLDDIINDNSHKDELDIKLDQIKNLHFKIITDKKKRKKANIIRKKAE